MATASPTPIAYGGSRLGRAPSTRPQLRQASPLSALGQSQGFTSNVDPLQHIGVGDSSDDDMPAMPKLSKMSEGLLGQSYGHRDRESQRDSQDHDRQRDGQRDSQRRSDNSSHHPHSPRRRDQTQPLKHTIRISRNNTPKQESTTPGIRIKRPAISGAPMRRNRRTPQGDDDINVAAQDQENLQASIVKPDNGGRAVLVAQDDSMMKPATREDSIMKAQMPIRTVLEPKEDKPAPLGQRNVNTPMRQAPPPPPPKMCLLETATVAAGAAATKQKRRRGHMIVNGKQYTQLDKIGKGGSAQVYRVMAENGKLLALKRVKLDDADETSVMGYKGEIALLQKLQGESRVVHLYDFQVDEEKQCLSVLLEMGDSDLARVVRSKNDIEGAKLDLPFTRHYWKEMLECVAAVHDHEIVHSDLKPANFLLVQGQLKLIDFGIAGAIDVENTVNVHRDTNVGTPNYMSPESLLDSNADVRQDSMSASTTGSQVHVPIAKLMRVGKPSDVWSLGCILYQMTYGRPPFGYIEKPLQRVLAIINKDVHITFEATGIGGVKVPPALKKTLKACLNREPSERPSVAKLLDEEDPWLYPEAAKDLPISEDLLGLVIRRVAERFWESDSKGVPTKEDVESYPSMFYSKLRVWLEEGRG